MSAIPPPPIPSVVEEAYEVRRESVLALESLRSAESARAERGRRRSWLGSLAGLALFGTASAAAVLAGGLLTARRRNRSWYRALRKPAFTPPARAFAIVWPVLYTLGALSAWRVARAITSR